MRDAAVIAGAVSGGFVLLSATVFYSASRFERMLLPANQSSTASASKQTVADDVKLNAEGVRVDRVMTYDFFARYWRSDFAQRAERDCWTPLEQSKKFRSVPSQLHFVVEVDADGSVLSVKNTGVDENLEGAGELSSCLIPIINTMKFAPSGKRQSGPVQADRPRRGGT